MIVRAKHTERIVLDRQGAEGVVAAGARAFLENADPLIPFFNP